MKKTSFVLSVLVICLIFINTGYSSSVISYRGYITNEHIVFFAIKENIQGMRPGSSTYITFKIESRQSYKISTRSKVVFNRKTYKFKPEKVENDLFKNGEIRFEGTFNTGSIIELEYIVRKNGAETDIRIVKKYKTTITRLPRHSFDQVEVKLEELAN